MTVVTDEILESFRHISTGDLTLVPEGTNRYRVFSPFMFPDGDHLSLVLKREESRWLLSDEGHTMIRLSFRTENPDMNLKARKEVTDSILTEYGIQDRDGEFICPMPDEQYGDSLIRMAQGLIILDYINSLSPDIQTEKIVKPCFNWAGGLADVQEDVFSLQKKSLFWRDTDEKFE